MLLRGAVLAVLTFIGFLSSPSSTAAPYQSDVAIVRAASLQVSTVGPRRVVRWLRDRPQVAWVAIGTDHHTIELHLRDGIRAAILPAAESGVAMESGTFRTLFRQRQVAQGRAAVWEPFASELGLGPNAGDPEVSSLSSAGFQVNQAYDTAVTIQLLTTMSSYNVVYMHTHSGTEPNGDGIVASGEPVDGNPFVQPFLADGSVIITGVAGTSQAYYGINSRFIANHLNPFPAHALVYLNGCNLLGASVFSGALLSKGAGVMISWNNDSAAMDDYFAGAAFFSEMNGGKSVAQAIASMQSHGVGVSNVPGQPPASLGFVGDGSITLAATVGGPSPQPTASPTPTTRPSPNPTQTYTPSPTPTRTSGPGSPPPTATNVPQTPRAKIHLKSSVAPGHIQTLSVQLVPAMAYPVSASVVFPNGVTRQFSRLVATDGQVTWSFKQSASMITRHSRVASVRVALGDQGEIDGGTAAFTVKFGKIDLSAEPRLVTSRHTVSIWVHAGKRSEVKLTVNKTHKSVRTGRDGWVRYRYKAPRVRSGVTRNIKVRASTRSGGHTYRTNTSFVVQG